MTIIKDFVENEDSKFAIQLRKFFTGLGLHGVALGFDPSEISAADKDASRMEFVVERQAVVQGYAQGYTGYKNSVRFGSKNPVIEPLLDTPASPPAAVDAGIETRFRLAAGKAKRSSAYTKEIGQVLGIEAPEASTELGVPEFIIDMAAGHPVIKWKKKTADAVQLWKDSGNGFVLLDTDFKSPYIDKSDLPLQGKSAVWTYKLIYIIGEEAVGDYSAPQSVTVMGEVTGTRGVTN